MRWAGMTSAQVPVLGGAVGLQLGPYLEVGAAGQVLLTSTGVDYASWTYDGDGAQTDTASWTAEDRTLALSVMPRVRGILPADGGVFFASVGGHYLIWPGQDLDDFSVPASVSRGVMASVGAAWDIPETRARLIVDWPFTWWQSGVSPITSPDTSGLPAGMPSRTVPTLTYAVNVGVQLRF